MCASDLRPADSEEDMRRIIRVVRPDFLSRVSSLVEGESAPMETLLGERIYSLLERRLLFDMGRPMKDEFVCVEGGREGDTVGVRTGVSMVIDFRRSAKEFRVSLMRSFTMVMEDLRSFLISIGLGGSASCLSGIMSLGGT